MERCRSLLGAFNVMIEAVNARARLLILRAPRLIWSLHTVVSVVSVLTNSADEHEEEEGCSPIESPSSSPVAVRGNEPALSGLATLSKDVLGVKNPPPASANKKFWGARACLEHTSGRQTVTGARKLMPVVCAPLRMLPRPSLPRRTLCSPSQQVLDETENGERDEQNAEDGSAVKTR